MTPARPHPARARGRVALAALVGGLLVGCASAPPGAAPAQWTVGRMSVRIDAFAGAPARSVAADFELRGDATTGELRLSGPLGAQLAVARWSPADAVLSAADGERRFADLDALAREALGEALPLAALPDWLAGRPLSSTSSRATTDGFEQLGWQVVLTRRAEGWIEARRDAPPAVTVRVKLDPDRR